jgi:uncharacterized protein YjbI with pentapeptide repeats
LSLFPAHAINATDLDLIASRELKEILALHQAFVKNTYTGRRAKLLSRDLAGCDLSGRVLAGADFSGSNLSSSNLKFANLAGATLYCCDLSNADGRHANFAKADMRGTTLSGGNLSHACLDGADFRTGRLLMSDPSGKETIVDHNGSAAGVNFSYCSLNGASFEDAELKGANFTGALLLGAKFKGARMAGATFKGAILTEVEISEINLPREALNGCLLPPDVAALDQKTAMLLQLKRHQRWIDSNGRSDSAAILDDLDLRPLADIIGKFRLTALSARRVVAPGVNFSGTELQGSNFEGADLRGASFEGADLRGARFHGAMLHHARFVGADMRPLALRAGNTLACDISGTGFTSEQREEAIFA